MSNPQRKGQWLINKLLENTNYNMNEDMSFNDRHVMQIYVNNKLWNLSNVEFDKIMREYYD